MTIAMIDRIGSVENDNIVIATNGHGQSNVKPIRPDHLVNMRPRTHLFVT